MKVAEDQIIAYLLGELEGAEAAQVQQAIADDPAVQAIVADYERLMTGFREKRVQKYTAEVAQINPADTPSESPKRRPWWKRGGWIGGLVVGLIAGFLLLKSLTTLPAPTSQELATTHFILPADPTVAGQSEIEATFRDGLNAFFREEDYSAANRLFASIRTDSLLGLRAQYYEGHARFLSREYPMAEELLQDCLTQADRFSRIERNNLSWNILMTQLAQGQDIQALLEEQPDSERKQELLEALGSE